MYLKFEINAYDPAIVQQLILSGEPSSAVESRRPTLAWLEDSSSCSDIPKLEGDRYVRSFSFLVAFIKAMCFPKFYILLILIKEGEKFIRSREWRINGC